MDLASDIGVSKKDLNQSIRLLLEYLDDKRETTMKVIFNVKD